MVWRFLSGIMLIVAVPIGMAQAFEAVMLEEEIPSIFGKFGEPLDADGDWALIGTGDESVIFFTFADGEWVQQQTIENEIDADFGDAVALSGEYALVGAHNYDLSGFQNAGAVFVYHYDGSAWVEQQILTADDPQLNAQFGKTLAIDGDYLVIGDPAHNMGDADYCGAAYVFHNDGGTWSQDAQLIASDYSDHATFGCSVTMSGQTIIAGAREADPAATSSGAAYVYTYDGSEWVEQLLSASDGAGQDYFGTTVALDGDQAFIGAHGCDEAGDNAGAVYVFENNAGTWEEVDKLNGPGREHGNGFSKSMALEGDWAMVRDENGADMDGSVFMYQYDGSSWNQLYEVSAWTGGMNHRFGAALAQTGETAFISDADESISATFAGCVWACTDLANPAGMEEVSTEPVPSEFALLPAYPNPFNSKAVVSVRMPHRAELVVSVYNTLGQRVSILSRTEKARGMHRMTFDATDLSGGIYFVRAEVPGQWHAVRKMVLLK
ncbi:T9SS type A sorting domain-containing protein [bacterium]|nr:T9SS type A sorting domain-containing protein [bacterium]